MAFMLALFIVLLRILYVILYPFLFYTTNSQRKIVPPSTDDLLKISATKLSQRIRQRKISSEDVVRAYIKRIKEVNPLLNAVVEERFEDALKEAKSVTDYLRTTSLTEDELRKIKPLLGVPITIKESCMLSGMSYAVGTVTRQGVKADTDGDAVARIKMSGAIPLLVSNTPELCMFLLCDNNVTGATNNPYDLSRNSGGSSGGEAALLGAGASLIGVGSDLAGSIRFPAMSCGVFGHKPTPRTIPLRGHFPLPTDKKISEYLTIGPLSRYAEDLKLLMGIMSEKQATDLRLYEKVDLRKVRLYHMEEFPQSATNPRVQEEFKNAVNRSVEYLVQNCRTSPIDTCNFKEGFSKAYEISISAMSKIEGIPNLLKGEANQNIALECLKALMGQSKFSKLYLYTALQISLKDWINDEGYSGMCDDLRRKILAELKDDGVILCPTFSSPAMRHNEGFFKINNSVYTQIFNVLGLPSTQIPCGVTSEGLPFGIQVVAAPNQDRLCFAIAEELEKCFGGWIPPSL